ncbi:hypothetical protein PG988_000042 [Apiospora saccharicola]
MTSSTPDWHVGRALLLLQYPTTAYFNLSTNTHIQSTCLNPDKAAWPRPPRPPANAGIGEDKPKAFDAQGAIGKQFTDKGAIGGTAAAIGGPLAKDGMVGKQFTTAGGIGGSVQNAMGGTKGPGNN